MGYPPLLTGGAPRKPRLAGGVRARNPIWFFPAGEPRPAGEELHFEQAPIAYPFAYGYGKSAIMSRAVSSRRPHMRFMFWTACPEAPFTRLSMAERMMTRFVLGSTDSP